MIYLILGYIGGLFTVKIYKFIKETKEYNQRYKKIIKEFNKSLKEKKIK